MSTPVSPVNLENRPCPYAEVLCLDRAKSADEARRLREERWSLARREVKNAHLQELLERLRDHFAHLLGHLRSEWRQEVEFLVPGGVEYGEMYRRLAEIEEAAEKFAVVEAKLRGRMTE